jgi:hypothetical protein
MPRRRRFARPHWRRRWWRRWWWRSCWCRRSLYRPQRNGLGGRPARPIAPRRLFGSHHTRPPRRIFQWARIGLAIACTHLPLRTQHIRLRIIRRLRTSTLTQPNALLDPRRLPPTVRRAKEAREAMIRCCSDDARPTRRKYTNAADVAAAGIRS